MSVWLAQLDMGRETLGQSLIVISGVLIITWLLMRGRLRRGGAGDEGLTPQERLERIKQVGGMKNDLRQLAVEIEEMARRVGAQLDAKAIRLERLLDEADRKIAEHGRATGPSIAPATESPAAPDPEPATKLDPLTMKVYNLADEGLSPLQIATQLDEQVGKVELMLALRQPPAA